MCIQAEHMTIRFIKGIPMYQICRNHRQILFPTVEVSSYLYAMRGHLGLNYNTLETCVKRQVDKCEKHVPFYRLLTPFVQDFYACNLTHWSLK